MTLNGSLMTLDDFGPIPCTEKSPPHRARTDPSVSLYYFLSEPDCPPRIPGSGSRELSVGGYSLSLSLSLSSYSNSCLLSSPGRQQEGAANHAPGNTGDTNTLMIGDRIRSGSLLSQRNVFLCVHGSQVWLVLSSVRVWSTSCNVHNTFSFSMFSCLTNRMKL